MRKCKFCGTQFSTFTAIREHCHNDHPIQFRAVQRWIHNTTDLKQNENLKLTSSYRERLKPIPRTDEFMSNPAYGWQGLLELEDE